MPSHKGTHTQWPNACTCVRSGAGGRLQAVTRGLREDVANHARAGRMPAEVQEVAADQRALAQQRLPRRVHDAPELLRGEALVQRIDQVGPRDLRRSQASPNGRV